MTLVRRIYLCVCLGYKDTARKWFDDICEHPSMLGNLVGIDKLHLTKYQRHVFERLIVIAFVFFFLNIPHEHETDAS